MPQTSPREAVDIEALLDLAYRQKQVHRLGGDLATKAALGLTGGPRAPGSTFSTNDKVDTSSYAARMAAELRGLYLRLANAPDALLAVHDATLALPNFYFELGVGAEFLVWDRDTAAKISHRINPDKDAPTIVRVGPRRALRRSEVRPSPDAVELAEIGPRRPLVPIVTSTLLVVSALNCERPHVSEVEIARMRPIYRGADKRAIGHEPEYVTPLDVVAMERATYAAWHAALAMLVEALADLPGYAVTGPSAPAEPAGARRVILGRPQVVTWEAPEAAPAKIRKSRKSAVSEVNLASSKALTVKAKTAPKGLKKGVL